MTQSKQISPADVRIADRHGLADAAHRVPASVSHIASGVPAIDQLHSDLFSTLDELSSSDDKNFCSQFAVFVGKVEWSFREEESWMDELDYSAIAVHQEQHARVLGSLHHVHAKVMAGDLTIGRRVVDELLPQWLLFHISTMDTPFAQAMQQGGQSLLPS